MFTTCQWTLVKGMSWNSTVFSARLTNLARAGETFASTVFGVFSSFYLSFGAILTPAFNVAASFTGEAGSANSTGEHPRRIPLTPGAGPCPRASR